MGLTLYRLEKQIRKGKYGLEKVQMFVFTKQVMHTISVESISQRINSTISYSNINDLFVTQRKNNVKNLKDVPFAFVFPKQ